MHIYCGDGKGKTTAALGLILRASGRGLRVLVIRLMKDCDSGELKSIEKLEGVELIKAPDKLKFVWLMTDEEKTEYKTKILEMIREAESKSYDLLVIDEACSAVSTGLLELDCLINLIKNRPEGSEIVLTGRDPRPELLELADYVTEMKKVKHPFDRGIGARTGIEK